MRRATGFSRRDYLRCAGTAGVAGLTATAGCLGSVLGSGDPLQVAAMLPQSGQMSEYAAGIRTGIDLAVSDANEVGLPMGRGLELHTADTEGDPETAKSEYKRLVSEEEIDAFVGCLSFSVAQELEARVTEDEVYGISPKITEPRLTTTARKGQLKFLGRTAQDRGHIGKAVGEVMNKQGGDAGVIAHPDDDQSETLASMGEDIHNGVANTVAYNPEEGNYDEAVSAILEEGPTEVGVVGTPDQALELVTTLVDEGYTGAWALDEYLRTEEVASELGGELDGAFAVAPNPQSSPGKGNLQGQFDGETNEYSTYAYDAMALVALAIHQGQESQGYEVALNIADVSGITEGENVNQVEVAAGPNGLEKAKSTIDDRDAVNYQGASGLVNLSIDHNPLNRMGIFELIDESFSHIGNIPGEEFERETGGQATG